MTTAAYDPTEEKPSRKIFSVFIVDDDQSYLTALGFRLMKENKNSNTKIFCYSSGEDCLHNLKLNPSVVILDYYLDGSNPYAMSGLQTLRKIKKINPEVPVVMLSGQGNIDVALEIYEAGAYSYIMKNKHALPAIEKIIGRLTQQNDLD